MQSLIRGVCGGGVKGIRLWSMGRGPGESVVHGPRTSSLRHCGEIWSIIAHNDHSIDILVKNCIQEIFRFRLALIHKNRPYIVIILENKMMQMLNRPLADFCYLRSKYSISFCLIPFASLKGLVWCRSGQLQIGRFVKIFKGTFLWKLNYRWKKIMMDMTGTKWAVN